MSDVYEGGYCRTCGLAQYKARHDPECEHYDAHEAELSLARALATANLHPAGWNLRLVELSPEARAHAEQIMAGVAERRAERRAARQVEP